MHLSVTNVTNVPFEELFIFINCLANTLTVRKVIKSYRLQINRTGIMSPDTKAGSFMCQLCRISFTSRG